MIRVGIADDEELVREGIAALLAQEPGVMVVTSVATAHEAVELAGSGAIDVLLLDIQIGNRGGLEALEEILTRDAAAKVVMVSSSPEEEYAIRSLRAGAAGYVRKTSGATELGKAVREVAAGQRYISPEVAALLADFATDGPATPHERLSNREYQVFRLLAGGRSVTEVAEELNLSVSSVSTYRRRILEKLELPGTAALIRYAISRRLA